MRNSVQRMFMVGLFFCSSFAGLLGAQENDGAKKSSWIFPLQFPASGIFVTNEQGSPFTTAATLHFGRLASSKSEENFLWGPTIGLRFTHLKAGSDWEGFFGARVSSRLLRTILPIDLTVAGDASIGTKERIFTGISLAAGLNQGPNYGARFALDVNHGGHLLEVFATIVFRSKLPPPCELGLPNSGSFADEIALEAYNFWVQKRQLVRSVRGDLPASLPNSIENVEAVSDYVAGLGYPDAIASIAAIKEIVSRAGRPPQGWVIESRKTVEALLVGWREARRIIKCEDER